MTQPEIEIRRAWRHAAGPDNDGYVDALMDRYREPHRYYHTPTHIMLVIRTVHDLSAMMSRDPTPELVVAALYHDAIYDPRADDNEARSAELAGRDLTAIGWSPRRCSVVAALIEATSSHVIDRVETLADHETMEATAILLDADLAILGAEPLAYQAYATGVRAEYFFVNDQLWCTGRGRILRHFLDSRRLFHTDYMRSTLEHRARANIQAELAALGPAPTDRHPR